MFSKLYIIINAHY